MKKIIVNGVCASLVCFLLTSFTANSNPVGTNPGYSPLQDTSMHKMSKMGSSKKKMKMDKEGGDTGDTSKMKMKMKKRPA